MCLDRWLIVSEHSDEIEEDPSTQVMLSSMQDKDLVPIYAGLPDLGCISRVCGLPSLLLKFCLFPVSTVQSGSFLMLHRWEWVS